jgi:L-lysine 2,3-aminomutase
VRESLWRCSEERRRDEVEKHDMTSSGSEVTRVYLMVRGCCIYYCIYCIRGYE